MVNFETEIVAGFTRNGWQVWTGLPGRFEAESTNTNVVINNSKIIDNKVEYLANNKKYVEFNNVELINNTFLNNDKPFRSDNSED